ncbi:hypothetical protein [uncultured Clostridium sp.]|uniref:hypothetical protein n=1 Tax=uncultured Clostridium sp. TaxID=59620 RepID=UPI0032167C21
MEEKQFQIGFSDDFTYGEEVIKYEITTDNKLQLYVEDCARALGVTTSKKLKNGNISITVRWDRVYDDLVGIGVLDFIGAYNKLDKVLKYKIRNNLKSMTIDLKTVLMWCKNTNTHKSNEFIQALHNVDNGNNKSIKEVPDRKELEFFKILLPILNQLDIDIKLQYKVLDYKIDGYIPSLKLAIEYDENGHKHYLDDDHINRQDAIEKELGCEFIRVTDDYDYGTAIVIIIAKINYKLYKPIIDMKTALKNDILSNNDVIEPYEIIVSMDKIELSRAYTEKDDNYELWNETLYCKDKLELFREMFDINVIAM